MSKIIVVDNEPRTANLVRSLATPMGFTVFAFDNYETAAAKVETQPFDAIFLGIQASLPASLDLMRRIRKSDPDGKKLIVALSPNEDVPTLREAYGAGADLFLIKPVAGERLSRMLAAFPEWKNNKHAARLPLFVEVTCSYDGDGAFLRSLNISESGMLLQPALDVEVGRAISLEFKLPEPSVLLRVVARVTRKEGRERMGVGFVDLVPEDLNAIHLYVTGRMKDTSRPAREFLSNTGPRRLLR